MHIPTHRHTCMHIILKINEKINLYTAFFVRPLVHILHLGEMTALKASGHFLELLIVI